MGFSMGGTETVVQQVPVYNTTVREIEKESVTSAVAKSISTGAEAQVQAQNQARQRSSGIISTFKRFMSNDSSTSKNKLGQ